MYTQPHLCEHHYFLTFLFSDPVRTHTHPFNGPLPRTTRVSRYQKGEINLDFTEARDSEWQWHQLGRMQVCTSLQTDNHTSTPLAPPLSSLQAGCPSCHPTNSVKALKAVKISCKICFVSGVRNNSPWATAYNPVYCCFTADSAFNLCQMDRHSTSHNIQ